MSETVISPELKSALSKLKLSGVLDTLPERLVLARQQKMPHQDFLTLVLADEASRREAAGMALRSSKARLDPSMTIENWDPETKTVYDKALWAELLTLRFAEEHHHVCIMGPVGVGKTFMATILGHVACRRRLTAHMARFEHVLKTLKHARLDGTYDAELRKLIAVDLLLLDDFAMDPLDPSESRDLAEIVAERHRSGSIVLTSNRHPDEWLPLFPDPLRGQSVVDRLHNNAYDLVIEGESYRRNLKPGRERPKGSERTKR